MQVLIVYDNMDKITKPNDIFAAFLQKPDLNSSDLIASNLNLSNTQLLPIEEYKKSPVVSSIFKTDKGEFDELKFKEAYVQAALLYNNLDIDNTLSKALEFDPLDFTAPSDSKKIDVRPVAFTEINPFKNLYGRTEVFSVDESDLSLKELAQQSKIFDYTSKKWTTKSANDLGLFGTAIGETLVYATWDEDGVSIDPITNKQIAHKKGEWKFDDTGNLYVETLGDREMYGKQIVNPLDVLTKEGSSINKIDFFDSDGKDKSVAGTTMKFMASVAPYLIPGFNVWYGGFNMALGLASVLPTFYKAAEGLFLGDNKNGTETDLWKKMNAAEGFMSKYNTHSVSEAGEKSLFTYEQLGSMISDVFSQIYEQRAAASLSKLFYKTADAERLNRLKQITDESLKNGILAGKITTKKEAIEIAERAFAKGMESSGTLMKQSKLAKSLSLGYMALSQSSNVYGDALAAGYDRRTAGFTALMAASGQYALMMNNRMGDWFLDKSTGYTENESRAAIRKIANGLFKESKEAIGLLDDSYVAGSKGLGKVFGKFRQKVDDLLFTPLSESEFAENIFKRSLIEGIEEVTEQAAMDMAKGVTDFLSYVGLTEKQGSFGGWSNVFSQRGLQEYLANFIGGAIGGPMFEIERSVISPLLSSNGKIDLKTKSDLYSLIANGKASDLYDYIDKNKGKFGSTELSPVITEIDGEKFYLPSNNDASQADLIALGAKNSIKRIEELMYSEGLGNSDEDLIKKSVIDQIYINDIKKSGVDKFILSDIKDIGLQILAIKSELENLPEEGSPKSSELKSKLNDLRSQYTDIMLGKKSEYYHGLSLFTLNPKLHGLFTSLSVDQYTKYKYNKDYHILSAVEKSTMDNEFKILQENSSENFKGKFKLMYDLFLNMNENFSKSLKDFDADGYASVRSGFYETFHTLKNDPSGTNFIKALERLNEVNQLILNINKDPKSPNSPTTHKLDSQTYLSLGKFLTEEGFISQLKNKDELKNIQDEFLKIISEKYGIDISNEEESRNSANLLIETNKSFKKLKEQVPDYSNFSLYELLQLITLDEAIIGDTTYKVDLSEQDKQLILSKLDSAVSVNDLFILASELIQKINNGEVVSEEEMTNLGLIFNEDQELNKIEIIKAYSNYLNEFNNLKTLKSGELFDQELDTLYEKFDSDINQTENLSDEHKEIIASIIDQFGLPTRDLNTQVIQQAINSYFSTFNQSYQSELAKIEKIEDETQKIISRMRLDSIASAPIFKLNEIDDYVISPRRKLLIRYGKDLIAKGEALDSEVISELKQEKEIVENLLEQKNLEEGSNLYNNLEEEANAIDKILNYENIKINQLYEKLRSFEIDLFGSSEATSIFTILMENTKMFDENVISESDFTITPVQRIQIERALQTLQAVEGVLTAMSTTQWSIDELYGMNIMLNKALEKEGEAPKYEYVTSQASHIIQKDIQLIKSKLDYFKYLSEKTSKSIVENDLEISKVVIDKTINQYLDKNDKLSIVNLTVNINGKINNLFTSDDLVAINQIEDKELKLIEIESRFYNNFHNIEGNLDEKLNSLFNAFIGEESKEDFVKSIVKSRNSNLSKDFEKFELFDLYSNLHYILAQDSKNFYTMYKNNLKKELTLQDKKASLFSQMLVIKQTIAYIKRKDIVSHISSFLQKNLEDIPANLNESEKIQAVIKNIRDSENFRIENLIRILGSGGTGKSSVIANSVLRMILDNKLLGEVVEIITSAPTKKTLDTLSKDIKGESLKDTKIESLVINDFVKSLLTENGLKEYQNLLDILSKETADPSSKEEWEEYIKELNPKLNNKYFIAGEGFGAVLITDQFFREFIQPLSDNDIPKIFIADEMSKITTLEKQILNYISKSTEKQFDDYYVILMGDELQGGVKIGNQSFSDENILSPRTIKMKNPIRARNNVKNQNNIILELFTESIFSERILKNGNALKELTLGYFEQEGKFLTGDKIVTEITEEDLLKLDPNKEITITTESGEISEELREKLNNVFGTKEIQIVKFSNIQGREFDQLIVDDLNLDKSGSYVNRVRDFYTLFTRAKETTLANVTITLNINNEKKSSSIPYNIDSKQIEKSLVDRINYLESLNLSETKEKTKEVIINKFEIEEIEDIINEPPPIPIIEPDSEKIEEHPIKPKDLNKMLAYSFFNNLGLSRNSLGEIPPIREYLNKEIVYTPENDDQITWDELRKIFSEYSTGTDLFSIDLDLNNITLKEVIDEYVKFKNELLFTKEYDGKLFGSSVNIEKQWILKQLTENNSDKPLFSYGKIVNKDDIPSGKIYAVGTYFTIFGNKTFVTLAVTPNLDNPNVNAANLNIDILKDVYDKVDSSSNKELQINKSSIEIYKGVVIPKDKILNSTSVHKVLIKQGPLSEDQINKGFKRFEDVFPGAFVSDVKLFKDDVSFIESELRRLNSYGVVETAVKSGKIKEDVLKTFRFRPYVEVSYLENNNRFTRIIFLNNNKRSASEFWKEFKEIGNKNQDLEEAQKMNFLITHYRSWEILFDYFKQSSFDRREEIVNSMLAGFMYNNKSNFKRWEPFKRMMKSLAEWDYNNSFEKWIQSSEFIKNIVTHNKEYKNQDEFKWGNILHAVASYLNNDEFDNFMENYTKEIYYNPIIKSLGSQIQGARLADLQVDNYKNFYMDVAVESSQLLIDMTLLLKKDKPKKPTKPTVTVEETKIPKIANLSFTILGKEVKYSVPLRFKDIKIIEDFKTVYNSFMQTNNELVFNEVTGELEFEDIDGVFGDKLEMIPFEEILNMMFNEDNYNITASGHYVPSYDIFKATTVKENSEIKCTIE